MKLKTAKYESRLMTKLLQGTAHTNVISHTSDQHSWWCHAVAFIFEA